jgi:hypothetical protein
MAVPLHELIVKGSDGLTKPTPIVLKRLNGFFSVEIAAGRCRRWRRKVGRGREG